MKVRTQPWIIFLLGQPSLSSGMNTFRFRSIFAPTRGWLLLLSQHQDAELLSQAAHFAGLETVRGSTHRGATAALKSMLTAGRGRNLAITRTVRAVRADNWHRDVSIFRLGCRFL